MPWIPTGMTEALPDSSSYGSETYASPGTAHPASPASTKRKRQESVPAPPLTTTTTTTTPTPQMPNVKVDRRRKGALTKASPHPSSTAPTPVGTPQAPAARHARSTTLLPWDPSTAHHRVPLDLSRIESAAQSGSLPPHVVQVLEQSSLCPKSWAQPHLEHLRAQVLRGERPDLVQHYLTKVLAVNRMDNKPRDPKRQSPSAPEESTSTDGTTRGPGPGPARRLTAEQRQANHSASESKRRGNIRSGYQGLVRKVPRLGTTMNPKDVKVGVTHEIGYLLSGTSSIPSSIPLFLMMGGKD